MLQSEIEQKENNSLVLSSFTSASVDFILQNRFASHAN